MRTKVNSPLSHKVSRLIMFARPLSLKVSPFAFIAGPTGILLSLNLRPNFSM